MKKPEIDSTDREILSFLCRDARMSNREIAQKLDIAEGTVRARVKRMVDEKSIRFTALTTELEIATPLLSYVGLRVDLEKLTSVAEALCEFSEIRFVSTTLGRFDIFVILLVDSVDSLSQIISDKIMKVDGVRRVESSVSTETLKYDFRWGKVA